MPPEKTGINSNDWIPNWNGEDNVLTSVMGGQARFPCIFQVKFDLLKNYFGRRESPNSKAVLFKILNVGKYIGSFSPMENHSNAYLQCVTFFQ